MENRRKKIYLTIFMAVILICATVVLQITYAEDSNEERQSPQTETEDGLSQSDDSETDTPLDESNDKSEEEEGTTPDEEVMTDKEGSGTDSRGTEQKDQIKKVNSASLTSSRAGTAPLNSELANGDFSVPLRAGWREVNSQNFVDRRAEDDIDPTIGWHTTVYNNAIEIEPSSTYGLNTGIGAGKNVMEQNGKSSVYQDLAASDISEGRWGYRFYHGGRASAGSPNYQTGAVVIGPSLNVNGVHERCDAYMYGVYERNKQDFFHDVYYDAEKRYSSEQMNAGVTIETGEYAGYYVRSSTVSRGEWKLLEGEYIALDPNASVVIAVLSIDTDDLGNVFYGFEFGRQYKITFHDNKESLPQEVKDNWTGGFNSWSDWMSKHEELPSLSQFMQQNTWPNGYAAWGWYDKDGNKASGYVGEDADYYVKYVERPPLTVKVNVEGDIADRNQMFTFAMTIYDSTIVNDKISFKYSDGRYEEINPEDFQYGTSNSSDPYADAKTFTLKAGEYVEIRGMGHTQFHLEEIKDDAMGPSDTCRIALTSIYYGGIWNRNITIDGYSCHPIEEESNQSHFVYQDQTENGWSGWEPSAIEFINTSNAEAPTGLHDSSSNDIIRVMIIITLASVLALIITVGRILRRSS